MCVNTNTTHTAELTPVMQQYLKVKAQNPNVLLFYQMGDFFELFYNDAEVVANVLGITLTKRSFKNHTIPMCGVPCHNFENHLNRLIKLGFKVAVCEQLENPEEAKQRGGSKAVVQREVTRIVTAGTILEENLLPQDSFNYLVAIYVNKKQISLAWIDISTRDFWFESNILGNLRNILYRINPTEIIATQEAVQILKDEFNCSEIPEEKFDFIVNKQILADFFRQQPLINLTDSEAIACGVLLDYVQLTQKQHLQNLTIPKQWNRDKEVVHMDFFTRQSLELNKKNNGETVGSLKHAINKTVTSGGNRLLSEWINSPLTNQHLINQRLDVVEYFYNNQNKLNNIRAIFKSMPDLTRAVGRLSFNKGWPQDLLAIRYGIAALNDIRMELFSKEEIPHLILESLIKPVDYTVLFSTLSKALPNQLELGTTLKTGGFVKQGFKGSLDILINNHKEKTLKIRELEAKYIEYTKITNLRIQYKANSGYFIEVNTKFTQQLLADKTFIHKQSLVNVARFTTEELLKEEAILFKAQEQALLIEQEVFQELVGLVLQQKEELVDTANVLSQIDILMGFSVAVLEYDLIRPEINTSNNLTIKNGRHLVVEIGLKKNLEQKFTPNDCIMNESKNLFLITGSNMAGKSTFLRQNAIIIIMAQMGCFVAADCAQIGVVDKIFSRVGSADNLYKGQSTFMVEMLELATILNNATPQSFIILDEIGRGTATYDGLSIAYATVEYIHEVNKSRTLFATHYHELTKLQETLEKVDCYNVEVKSFNKDLIFMHKVIKGVAGKSYGIHVAKLAGMPIAVLSKAEEILANLEQQSNDTVFKNYKSKDCNFKLPLFEVNTAELNPTLTPTTQEEELIYQPLIDLIQGVKVDEYSPKQALDFLYKLKAQLQQITANIN